MPITTRPYEPADRTAALALGIRAAGLDQANHHTFISDDGTGAALWVHPIAGEIAHLGPVVTKPPNRALFYQLVRACALDALDAGFKKAEFEVRNPRLLSIIRRDFTVTVEVYGRNGRTQQPTSWRIEVDIADALRQLDARLA